MGELYNCSCLPVLPGPAWVLLSYVLHTFISGSVKMLASPYGSWLFILNLSDSCSPNVNKLG